MKHRAVIYPAGSNCVNPTYRSRNNLLTLSFFFKSLRNLYIDQKYIEIDVGVGEDGGSIESNTKTLFLTGSVRVHGTIRKLIRIKIEEDFLQIELLAEELHVYADRITY